jgi:hypothetical protein
LGDGCDGPGMGCPHMGEGPYAWRVGYVGGGMAEIWHAIALGRRVGSAGMAMGWHSYGMG